MFFYQSTFIYLLQIESYKNSIIKKYINQNYKHEKYMVSNTNKNLNHSLYLFNFSRSLSFPCV